MNRAVTAAALVVLAALCIAVAATWRPVLEASTGAPSVPERLDETGLYAPDRAGIIDPSNRLFTPQYPLWSDGLVKTRWIYLPPGTAIDAADVADWKFPVGTKLWKQFSLGDRPVETRFLWKTAADRWVFASYAWDEDGTAATLAPSEGMMTSAEVAPRRQHAIPSRTDCVACHGSERDAPLGFNAVQLSTDRDPNAIHGEPLPGGALTLEGLLEERRLVSSRTDLIVDPPRIRTADPETRAVLGYLASNCGMCHDGGGQITAAGPTVRWRDLMIDGDAVARSLERRPTRWQIPGAPEGATVVVHPGQPELSAMLARMRSRAPSSQMPPLGTAVRDQAAVDLVDRWIRGERTTRRQ
jgi:cytochrome c553